MSLSTHIKKCSIYIKKKIHKHKTLTLAGIQSAGGRARTKHTRTCDRTKETKTLADRTVRSSARNCLGGGGRLPCVCRWPAARFGHRPSESARPTRSPPPPPSAVAAKCNHLFVGGGHPTGRRRRLLCVSNCGDIILFVYTRIHIFTHSPAHHPT